MRSMKSEGKFASFKKKLNLSDDEPTERKSKRNNSFPAKGKLREALSRRMNKY